jgi:hypothetical protein
VRAGFGGVEGGDGAGAVSGAERAEDLVAPAGIVEERQGGDLVECKGSGESRSSSSATVIFCAIPASPAAIGYLYLEDQL